MVVTAYTHQFAANDIEELLKDVNRSYSCVCQIPANVFYLGLSLISFFNFNLMMWDARLLMICKCYIILKYRYYDATL